jgi:hypothetical protein
LVKQIKRGTNMTINKKRKELLLENFFEFYGQEGKPSRDFFDTITNSEELHFIAKEYNWDDGSIVLEWIVNHPQCDEATAKLIFWRGSPEFHQEYETEEEVPIWCKDGFRLLKQIISNFESGFYKKSELYYNVKENGRNVNEKVKNAKWEIPEVLKKPCNR